MDNIKRRVEKLEKVVVPGQSFGKHSLSITVGDGEGCDIALQREIAKKGISLTEVGFITFCGGLYVECERDLRNHPEWDYLQKLYKAQRIIKISTVKDKTECEEYQKLDAVEHRHGS